MLRMTRFLPLMLMAAATPLPAVEKTPSAANATSKPSRPPAPAPAAAAALAAPQVTTILSDDFRKVFTADAGKVRLVLLFSPT